MENIVLFTIAVITIILVWVINNTKEGFWMTPSRILKVEKVFKEPDSHDFFSTPNFQSQLSPRFSNVDYGANLRSEFPSPLNMGVPVDPLSGQAGYMNASYKPDGSFNETAYANGNYNQVLNTVMQQAGNGWPTSTIEADVSTPFFSQDGTAKQPIIYDRYIYANRNSRLRGLGDPIRGDLPITPISGNWFVPSGAYEGPNAVLQHGAMNVMGGVNNETSNQLANLIYNSSGGTETAIGGIDMKKYNMGNSYYGSTSAGRGDVSVTAFP